MPGLVNNLTYQSEVKQPPLKKIKTTNTNFIERNKMLLKQASTLKIEIAEKKSK